MRIHHAVAVIALALAFVGGSPAHATKPVQDRHYVKIDALIATAAQKLSPATADEIKKAFDGKRGALFAGRDPSQFSEGQFVGKSSWGRLCEILQREDVLDKSKGCDLNGLLKQPWVYERVKNMHTNKTEPESLRTLRQAYESKQCETIQVQAPTHRTEAERKADCTLALTKLNRAVLAAYYPKECPPSPETKEDLVQIGVFFLEDFIRPYVQRNEIAKVKQFLQAVNQKKLVYAWREGKGGGCYVVDYAIEIKSAPSSSDEAGVYMTVTQKHYAGGICREWASGWETSHYRALIR